MQRLFLLTFLLFLFFHGKSQDSGNKISQQLQKKISRSDFNDSITVSVSTTLSFDNDSSTRWRLLKEGKSVKVFLMRCRVSEIPSILDIPGIIFINEVHTPKEELTTGAFDPTLNRINFVHHQFPSINGVSLNISIRERLFDTTDIDLRGRIFKTGLESDQQTVHASLMSTIVSGGGNTSPFAKGIAWASKITSSSFVNLFPDPDPVFYQNNISVQNHSYGTIIENFYGNEAMSYDLQANGDTILLHVFSAGNSGNVTTTTGTYAGVEQFANLTANFKHSKNSIAVAACDSSGQPMALSSKGPAYDGRVKPELVAYGEDGSSGAAAATSGVALLVQHAFKMQNAGKLPASSLVKSVLINSANESGMPGIDFYSGYGSVNAYKAVSTINEGRFLQGKINHNEMKWFPVTIPAGIKKIKITLAWNDPAALPNASRSLVNDLDLLFENISGTQSWHPWVLDHSPQAATLQLPAQRKRDTLNNVEQVTFDDPVAGDYLFKVSGTHIVTGSQAFSLAWELDTTDTFYWTFPTASDPLIAGNRHWLRWETNISQPGIIEYATDVNNWREVGTMQDVSLGFFTWDLPDTLTTAVLRMKISSLGNNFTGDTFTIGPQLDIAAGFNCEDSFLLYWKNVSGQYQLFHLDDRYLEFSSQVNDSSIIMDKNQSPSLYYSVSPLINGKTGIRSHTLFYPASGVECYIKSFYLQQQSVQDAVFYAELGTLYQVQEIALEKFTGNDFVTVQTVADPVALIFNLQDLALVQGENRYRVHVKLVNGKSIYSAEELLYHLPISPVLIYPNPVRQGNLLTIITNESGRYTLQVYGIDGKLAFNVELNNTITKVNTAILGKGIYMARILDNQGKSFTQKILVQ